MAILRRRTSSKCSQNSHTKDTVSYITHENDKENDKENKFDMTFNTILNIIFYDAPFPSCR
jgi:hypothetical protein